GEAQIEERARVVGLEADGLGVCGDGLFEEAETSQSDAEVVLRLGPVGFEPYRGAEGVGRLREERLALLVVLRAGLREVAVGRAEVEVRRRHVGTLGEHGLESINRELILLRV